jgi:hypothetical protein
MSITHDPSRGPVARAAAKAAIMKRLAEKKEKASTRQERRSLKKTARKEIRGKKKTNRQEKREQAKSIRKDAPKEYKRTALAANRVFHKSDKEGNKGGQEAVNVIRDRKKAQQDRKAARKA